MTDRLNARARAEEIAKEPHAKLGRPRALAAGARQPERRWFAMGDPQSSFDRFAAVLERHGLLGDDGMLREDVGLLSIGDHFDYGSGDDVEVVGREGLLILRWLAEHAPEQVVILTGNHDLARVQELAMESDASFASARVLASEIKKRVDDGVDSSAQIAEFAERFPALPTPELVRRDYSSFSETQRALVQALLLGRRLRLGCAATTAEGAPLLLTHAGVTKRDLENLGIADARQPWGIACALNDALIEHAMRVEELWKKGERAPLRLEPLHAMGTSKREGGGLCYHRPAHPGREGANVAWEFDEEAPRRFDPRELPLGLVQACGHSGHGKLCKELAEWVDAEAHARTHGGLRTLTSDGSRVRYSLLVQAPQDGAATMYFIDGEIDRVESTDYELLPLGSVVT